MTNKKSGETMKNKTNSKRPLYQSGLLSQQEDYYAGKIITGVKRGSFNTWLKDQSYRNDPVGDIARDMLVDKNFPVTSESYYEINKYLENLGACDGALRAISRAFKEYEKSNWPTWDCSKWNLGMVRCKDPGEWGL
jgi:uncharacterized protein YozE (UPF0346 family)